MPLDNSLDLQLSHRHHFTITAHLPDTDVRKHCNSTPLRIARSVKKIWENPEGAPNSECVVQDANRTFDAHKIVYEAEGKMVPGLANRNGHRNKKEGNLKWGGKRTKSYVVAGDIWLEAGARSVIEEKKIHTKAKYIEIVTGQLKKRLLHIFDIN